MKFKLITAGSTQDAEKEVNAWLAKQSSKIKVHQLDTKLHSINTGKSKVPAISVSILYD